MNNIRIDVPSIIQNGSEVIFKSPCDCSEISGMNVYYLNESGAEEFKSFVFKDAHGNNVGDLDNLFTEGVYVKVILNVDEGVAYIQNADTNKYLEERFEEIASSGGGEAVIETFLPPHVLNGESKTLTVGVDLQIGQVLNFYYITSKGYSISYMGASGFGDDFIGGELAPDKYRQGKVVIGDFDTYTFKGVYSDIKTDFKDHCEDTDSHVTEEDRENWNSIGGVEITPNEPKHDNTVLTLDPNNGIDLKIYTVEEIDVMFNNANKEINKVSKEAYSKICMEELWENASPESNFDEQDISLPSLADYDLFLVEFRLSTSSTLRYYTFAIKNASSPMHVAMNIGSTNASVTFAVRNVRFDSSGVVEFGGCSYKKPTETSASTAVGYLIPRAIYGIKGVRNSVSS